MLVPVTPFSTTTSCTRVSPVEFPLAQNRPGRIFASDNIDESRSRHFVAAFAEHNERIGKVRCISS